MTTWSPYCSPVARKDRCPYVTYLESRDGGAEGWAASLRGAQLDPRSSESKLRFSPRRGRGRRPRSPGEQAKGLHSSNITVSERLAIKSLFIRLEVLSQKQLKLF